MPTIIEISAAPEVNQNNLEITKPRLLARLELHLPPNIELTPQNAQDIRDRLSDIATTYALAAGEVTQ
ncbi:hypothetical protein [Gelidibacter pelagius]|uniref:Uncharacterized protein n=1 Tax=Gelidibacter pelagius TaxID=2819985 RepID=A0ABS3SPG0_9FLAO|nr:hypothetical protein [Gelidibacter pelagius]MBO3096817.1 hypothetical protein [Gelidibacter pelagius]